MNRNDKHNNHYPISVKFINDMLERYFAISKELAENEKSIKNEQKFIMNPVEFGMKCGQMAVYESILHGELDILTDEELFQSEWFDKEEFNKDA